MVFGPSKSYYYSSRAKLTNPTGRLGPALEESVSSAAKTIPETGIWHLCPAPKWLFLGLGCVTLPVVMCSLKVGHSKWSCGASDSQRRCGLGFEVPPQYLWSNCLQYSNPENTCSKRPLNCKWQIFQSPLWPWIDDNLVGSLSSFSFFVWYSVWILSPLFLFHPLFYWNMLPLNVWLTRLWMNPNSFHSG